MTGKFLVESRKNISGISYKVLRNLDDYENTTECIVVPNLNTDYFMLFGKLKLIITQRGSALSHLAILAREYKIPVFLTTDKIALLPKTGKIFWEAQNNTIKIKK